MNGKVKHIIADPMNTQRHTFDGRDANIDIITTKPHTTKNIELIVESCGTDDKADPDIAYMNIANTAGTKPTKTPLSNFSTKFITLSLASL